MATKPLPQLAVESTVCMLAWHGTGRVRVHKLLKDAWLTRCDQLF